MQESSDNAYYGDDMLVTTSMSALSSALDTEPTCPAGTFSQYEPVGPDVVARLVSLSDKSKSIDLKTSTTMVTIGRRSNNTVVFEDNRISGLHTRIYRSANDEWILEDLSFNGTFVNGNRVGKNQRVLLRNGDHVSLVSRVTTHGALFRYHSVGNTTLKYDFTDFGAYIFWDTAIVDALVDSIHATYQIGDELGRGSFSTVHAGMDKKTGEPVAIKIINKTQFWANMKNREQIIREVEILKNCRHPNIISYKAIFDCPDKLYLVLEKADGGDLFQLLVSKGAMVEESARTMFRQILMAVEYLHSKSIVHRDLKPENILLTRDGTAKLSDFGLARMLDAAAALKTLCGTPQYVAPEIITLGSVGPSNALNGYSHAVDMWSLGVILYIMLSGEPPFDTELNPTMSLYQQIETGTYEFPADLWDPVSPSAKDILVHLLEVDPNKRLTVSQALHHPWLTGRTTESSTSSQSRGNGDARGGFSQEDDDLPENRRLKKRKTESLLNGAFEEKLSLTNRPTSKEQVDMIQDDNKRRKVNQAEKEVVVVSASN